jgi:predicted anti-sigma-YlaC factor YlaD
MLTPVPPTDCMRAREAASARLDGELVELHGALLEAHLRVCPSCRAFADGIAATGAMLRGAALDQPSEPMFVPIEVRRRRFAAVPAAVAAAVVVAVAASSFAVGGFLGRQGSKAPAPAKTQTTALGGSIDALLLPALQPSSKGFHVTSRVIAL